MKLFKCEELLPKKRSFAGVTPIVDTSGFEPLEVKIKRMMLNGQIANLRQSLFDSYDLREMFDGIPDIVDDKYDDIEEVNEKIALINQKRAEILGRKKVAKAAVNSKEEIVPPNGTEKPEDTDTEDKSTKV